MESPPVVGLHPLKLSATLVTDRRWWTVYAIMFGVDAFVHSFFFLLESFLHMMIIFPVYACCPLCSLFLNFVHYIFPGSSRLWSPSCHFYSFTSTNHVRHPPNSLFSPATKTTAMPKRRKTCSWIRSRRHVWRSHLPWLLGYMANLTDCLWFEAILVSGIIL